MKNTTIALSQSVVALMAMIANAGLQTDALVQLGKSSTKNVDIDNAKKLLLLSVILQFVAAAIIIAVSVILIVNRQKLQQHMSKLVYTALLISGLLLLVGGSLGANVAVRLQCYRGDAAVNVAWQRASMSSIIGIVGPILLLLIQIFTRKDVIKDATRQHLITRPVRIPTHQPIPLKKQAAPMPVHHPTPYKKSEDYAF